MQYSQSRQPNASEKRLIARHAHRFYNNLLIAGVYQFPKDYDPAKLEQLETYLPALAACLDAHSFLSVVLRKNDEGKQSYHRPDVVNLKQHFHVMNFQGGARGSEPITQAVEHICNDPGLSFFNLVETQPPWRIDIMNLGTSGHVNRIFISFTYSHYIGDGMSGVAFQKTFAEALSRPFNAMSMNPFFESSPVDLPCLPHLPVSLVYLLGPALGHYLPRFIADWLGMKASVSGSDESTWAGGKTFVSPASIKDKNLPAVTTAVEIASINDETTMKVLSACRRHNTKLTSLLNEVIAECLSRHLPSYTALDDSNNFIASIPTNIRKLAGIPDSTMGIFASAAYSRHDIDRHLGPESEYVITEAMWSKSRIDTAAIHKSSTTLKDQPIALLNWITDVDAWMAGQIDRPRDVTWELSNLLAFDAPKSPGGPSVETMYFCQPADATGQPLVFNVISTKGGDLTICAAWQVGAASLDERHGEDVQQTERNFVQEVLRSLEKYLQVIAEFI